MHSVMRFVVTALGFASATPAVASPPARLPLRRVGVTFVSKGNVVSSPTSMVGGTQCQTFKHGLANAPPTVELVHCATANDQLRVTWIVRDGQRVLTREVTGSFAPGAEFDAGIPNVIAVRVKVGPTEGYLGD